MNPEGSETSGNASDATSPAMEVKKKKKEKRKEKKHKKTKKRKHRTSDSESENRKKSSKSKKRKRSKERKTSKKIKVANIVAENNVVPGPSVPHDLLEEQAKSRAPMTKEEWEKSQSVIRKVYDESSGRYRIIKGDGEILEEIVSKDRHNEINKQATLGDGAYFQSQLKCNRK